MVRCTQEKKRREKCARIPYRVQVRLSRDRAHGFRGNQSLFPFPFPPIILSLESRAGSSRVMNRPGPLNVGEEDQPQNLNLDLKS